MTLAPPAPAVPENTVASYSDLGKLAQCPRAWYLGTFRKLRRIDEPPTGPLPFGSRIHSALEAFYDQTVSHPVQAWNALMAHEFAVDEANGGWHRADLDKESKLGHRMMEGYIEWIEAEGEDALWDIEAVEQALSHHFTVDIVVDGQPETAAVLMRGKLDRRMRRKSDGATYIGDFKTAGNFSETTMLPLELSPQPRIYTYLVKQQDPEADVRGVVYTLLRKVLRTPTAKPPFFKRVIIEVNSDEQKAYDIRMRGVVERLVVTKRRLENGEDHRVVAPFQPSWACGSCPFKLPCQLMQHSPKGAEDMLADLYTESDPFARYLADPGADEIAAAQP
jgi:hypothetical protein